MNKKDGGAASELQWWVRYFKKYGYVLLVLGIGILLLVIPRRTDQAVEPVQAAEMEFDLQEMEQTLERAISKIEGAGDATVVLTLRSSERRVLAQDTQVDQRESSMETGQTTVLTSQGSGVQEAVLLQKIYPSYQGALVVCPGGDDPDLRLKLAGVVSSLTGLSSDKISICKGK